MPQRDTDEHTDDQYHDHLDRIQRTITAWENGEISTDVKRRAIAGENEIYYGGEFKSPSTGERITRMPRAR